MAIKLSATAKRDLDRAAAMIEHEITYLDGANIAVATGPTSLVEHEGRVVTVVVENDGAVFFIPAKLVIAWKEIAA